jgi:hypothetical protein
LISAVQTISICVNSVEVKQRKVDNCGPNFFLPFVADTWRSYVLCTCSRRRRQNPHQKHLVGCCHGCRCGQISRSYSCALAHSKPRKLRLLLWHLKANWSAECMQFLVDPKG